MTRLFTIKTRTGVPLLVAAVIDDDVWTYVANTGKFHRNPSAREDYFYLQQQEYDAIGIPEAQRLIAGGLGTFDAEADPETVQEWFDDPSSMDPDVVFASMAADLG
jgi:hypothetical protein